MRVLINNQNVTSDVVRGSTSITLRPNGERSASVSLYLVYPEIRDGLVYPEIRDGDELEIFEGSQTVQGAKLFGGIINSYSARLLSPISDEYPIYQIDVSSDGYNSIPQRRVVNYSGTNINASDVVRDMYELLDSETIFEEYIQSGADLPSYNVKYKTIAEVLDEMASVSGYTWYIDNARALHFRQFSSPTVAPFEIIEKGSFTDFHELSWSGSIDNYANRVFVVGDNNIVSVRENAAEIAERAQEADGQGTGIYGFVIQDSNIKSVSAANAVANTHLLKSAVRPAQLSFSTYTKGFMPGQKLKVQMSLITGLESTPPGSLAPAKPNIWYYLIDEVTIEKENDEITKYNITATRRYDSNFSTQKSAGFKEYFKNLVKK